MRRILFVLLLLLASAPVLAAQVSEDPQERQMLAIASRLRCTVCQNQPISESQADLARDMRQIIREQLAAGKSEQEIIDYFVARYGDYILLKPPYEGPGVLVWVGPAVLFGLLGISAWIYLRRRLRAPMPPPPEISDEDAARIREARRQASP
jgi:cytochrome c-type biogenesis protein CcmH